MSDHPPDDDLGPTGDRLGRLLRAGISALVAEAPEPPPFPGDRAVDQAPERVSRRSRVLVGAGAVVLLVAIGVVLALRDTGDTSEGVVADQPTSAPAMADRPLFGTYWRLESGRTQEGPLEALGELGADVAFVERPLCQPEIDCEPRPTLLESDGCNGLSAEIELRGSTITPGSGGNTLVGCTDGRHSAVASLFQAAFTYEIDGDRLRLASGATNANRGRRNGLELVYRAAPSVFPATDDLVLGEEGYFGRVRWTAGSGPDGPRLTFAYRPDAASPDAEPGDVVAEVGAPDPMAGTVQAPTARYSFVFGFVPASAATVTYQPGAVDEPVGIFLDVRELDGVEGVDDIVAFGGFVPDRPGPWSVIATDAAGNEVGRVTRP